MYSPLVMSYIVSFLDFPSKLKIYSIPAWDELVATNLSISYFGYCIKGKDFTPIAKAITYLTRYQKVFFRYQNQIFEIFRNSIGSVIINKLIPFNKWLGGKYQTGVISNKTEKVGEYQGRRNKIKIRYHFHISDRDFMLLSYQTIPQFNIKYLLQQINNNSSILSQYDNYLNHFIRNLFIIIKYYQDHQDIDLRLSKEEYKLIKLLLPLYSDKIFQELFFSSSRYRVIDIAENSPNKEKSDIVTLSDWPKELNIAKIFSYLESYLSLFNHNIIFLSDD